MTLIEGDDEPTSPPMFTGNVQQCLIGLTLLAPSHHFNLGSINSPYNHFSSNE